MGLRDRLKKHDVASIHALLVQEGATQEEATAIVDALGRRLTSREMHEWLAHPERCHQIEDDEKLGPWGVTGVWTPIIAVASGKAYLVVSEAQRFVGEQS